ncbi:MAG: alpha/beta fold hydrolase [Alphaproteobacteria bacterium]|nr:alpha/beta fold hydrolase [Alphaproteobacteria bacterium]
MLSKRFWQPGTAALFAMVVAGCGVADYGDAVEAYDRDYADQHRYTAHSVPRGELKLYARAFGSSEKNGKPPFILLHGFPDNLHLYDRLSPLLGADRQTIAFDFLGWGRSDKPDGHRYDAASLRTDLEAVIDYFKLDRVILVAHDASGFPVIDWTLDNPERTAGLVLLNTVYSPSEAVKAPDAIERFSSTGIKRDIAVFVASLFDGIWQSGHTEQLGKFYCDADVKDQHLKILSYYSFAMRPAFFGLNEVLREEIASRAKNLPRMKRFAPPVLVLFGAEDQDLNSGVAREFHDIFPNSTLHLLEGACHYVQLDAPAAVAKLILTAKMR